MKIQWECTQGAWHRAQERGTVSPCFFLLPLPGREVRMAVGETESRVCAQY